MEMMSRASAPDERFDSARLQPNAPPPASAPPPIPMAQATSQPHYPAPIVAAVSTSTTPPSVIGPGKSGFNKLCRDQAKLMLVLTTAFLFVNSCGPAMASSALAIFLLKRGTFWSHKNWKWGSLACISFLVSATGYFWVRGSNEINPNRAYGLKMWFWVSASFISGIWSIILGMFLASSYMSNTASLDPGFYYVAAQQAASAIAHQTHPPHIKAQ